jgi:hypothetical protein
MFSPLSKKLGTDFFGPSPPYLYVGWYGYPKVTVAPMSIPFHESKAELYVDSSRWFGKPIQEIVRMRSYLVRSWKKRNIVDQDRFVINVQELMISSSAVDVEVKLKKRPNFRVTFSSDTQPMGPLGELKKFRVVENPKVEPLIEKIISDTDLKASKAVVSLFKENIPVDGIVKLVSVGLLGTKDRRKMVPTRWAITMVDDTISKKILDKIKYFPQIDTFEVYTSNYLDNYFLIVFFPGNWEFEQLEAWGPNSSWNTGKKFLILSDHEPFEGRKEYAKNTSGAYYASRLAVTEALIKRQRQAAVLVIREVREGYYLPLGVWQIRENVRHALQKKPVLVETFKEVSMLIGKYFNIPFKAWVKQSKIIANWKSKEILSLFLGRCMKPV